MKALTPFVFLLFWFPLLSSAQTQSFEDDALAWVKANAWMAPIYQQKEHQPEDLRGDLLLLEWTRSLPKGLILALFRVKNPVWENAAVKQEELLSLAPEFVRKEGDTLEGTEVQFAETNLEEIELESVSLFAAKELAQSIIDEIQQSSFQPKRGTPIDWSPQFKKQYRMRYPIYSMTSKLLLCLAKGVTGRFMVTGKETELLKWIQDQPEFSISPAKLFRQAYEIAEGDVYLALLTAENVLSLHWKNPNREKIEWYTRLQPLAYPAKDATKFGHWYHLFGIMLYGYVKGGFPAYITAEGEAIGSLILNHFKPEPIENAINRRGAKVGAKLRRWVRKATQ